MDPTTVIVILSFHLVTSGCLLLLIRERTPQGRGLGWFGIGSILYGLGIVCRYKLGAEAVGLLSTSLDACMILAMLVFQGGLQTFTGRAAPRAVWLVSAVLGFVLLALLTAALYGFSGRHILVNVVLGAQQLAFMLFALRAARAAEATLHTPLVVFGGIMGLLGALTLLRGAIAMAGGVELLFEGWLAQLYSGFGSLVGVLLGPLVLWMVFMRLNARLTELATHDQLTGLLNRTGLEEVRRRHFGTRQPLPLSVLQLDLDHFKRINDAHGHGAGDQVLQAVAQTLFRAVREGDFVARTGGEEFLVGCVAVPPNAGPTLAERLREAVAAQHIAIGIGAQTLQCTISIGVSCAVRDLEGWEPALRQADKAMYAAKQAGRDRVVTADEEPKASAPIAAAPALVPTPQLAAAAVS